MFEKNNPSLQELLKAGAYIELDDYIVLSGNKEDESFQMGEKLNPDVWVTYDTYFFMRGELRRLWDDIAKHSEWTLGYTEDVSL